MKITKEILKRIIKEELQDLKEINFDKVVIPAQVKRFLGKFVDSMKDANLNRMKRSAILYKVIKAAGISTETLMQDIQKIKQGLKKNEGGEGSGRPTKPGSKRDVEKRMDKAVDDANARLDAAEKAAKAKKKKKVKEEKGGKKPGGKHLIYVLTKELKKAQKVLSQGGFKEGKHFSIQPNPKSKNTMGILMDKKVLNKVLEKFVGSKVNVYEGASPKLMKTISDTMNHDAYGDLEDLINGLNLDKKYYYDIDRYLDDIRDVEQGMKPSGYDKPARKNLLKVLKKAVITKRK